jgi:hypothetical protein
MGSGRDRPWSLLVMITAVFLVLTAPSMAHRYP